VSQLIRSRLSYKVLFKGNKLIHLFFFLIVVVVAAAAFKGNCTDEIMFYHFSLVSRTALSNVACLIAQFVIRGDNNVLAEK